MLSIDLSSVELVDETSELDPRDSIRFAFPLSSAAGTASSAVVLFELEPGNRLGRHTDSAEEVLLVLDGTVAATIGDERAVAGPGTVLVVPAMAPHGVENVGDGRARVVGFFSSATVVSTFEQPSAPGGEQVFVSGAPVPLAAGLAVA